LKKHTCLTPLNANVLFNFPSLNTHRTSTLSLNEFIQGVRTKGCAVPALKVLVESQNGREKDGSLFLIYGSVKKKPTSKLIQWIVTKIHFYRE